MLSRLQRVTIPLRSTVLRCYGSTSKSSSASTADKSEMDRFTSATGAPTSNDIPTELEHAVGIERLEILANLQGQHAFLDQPLQVKAKGTMKAPVLVESMLDERIVGCSGFPANDHELNWMLVRKEEVSRCAECGQVFKLDILGGGGESAHAH